MIVWYKALRYLVTSGTIHFSTVNVNFTINTNFTCDSGNLIYKITCVGCNEYYIGLTNNLRKRMTIHRRDLRSAAHRNMPLHIHLHSCAAAFEIPFTIVPFYKVRNDTFNARLAAESYFRRKFKPLLNGDWRSGPLTAAS